MFLQMYGGKDARSTGFRTEFGKFLCYRARSRMFLLDTLGLALRVAAQGSGVVVISTDGVREAGMDLADVIGKGRAPRRPVVERAPSPPCSLRRHGGGGVRGDGRGPAAGARGIGAVARAVVPRSRLSRATAPAEQRAGRGRPQRLRTRHGTRGRGRAGAGGGAARARVRTPTGTGGQCAGVDPLRRTHLRGMPRHTHRLPTGSGGGDTTDRGHWVRSDQEETAH
mmetsp:Transcript_36750/g.72278  ORF Transcript_36750/g.72278 Transcript_36750/m.72278 type:complete len:225 (+) Transcript_36750:634-1308(+)